MVRKTFMARMVLASWVLLVALLSAMPAQAQERRPNVLFIIVDDLNDWVAPLGGHPQAHTPNLDRLAQRGVLFTNAHCASPICMPSRTAVLTGMRPSSTGVYSNDADWRKAVPAELPLLHTWFRQHGYFVVSGGKVLHGRGADEGWDAYEPPIGVYGAKPTPIRKVASMEYGPINGTDEVTCDYHTVEWSIEQLNRPHGDKPFFIACGIYKPHLPFFAPQRYYDLYPLDRLELPAVKEDDQADVPTFVQRTTHHRRHAEILQQDKWKELVQAYLACVSHADAMVGRLMAALDASPHRDDTIVVLWSDHGWHLGEKQHWTKNTLYEESTHVPMIWIVPGLTKPGTRCDRPVDLLSLYPTLVDVTGLPRPSHIEGDNLRPLLADPQAVWEGVALTTRKGPAHSVRTDRWRYTRYPDGQEELYDHSTDPMEWSNLASDPRHVPVKADLARRLPARDKPEVLAEVTDEKATK